MGIGCIWERTSKGKEVSVTTMCSRSSSQKDLFMTNKTFQMSGGKAALFSKPSIVLEQLTMLLKIEVSNSYQCLHRAVPNMEHRYKHISTSVVEPWTTQVWTVLVHLMQISFSVYTTWSVIEAPDVKVQIRGADYGLWANFGVQGQSWKQSPSDIKEKI